MKKMLFVVLSVLGGTMTQAQVVVNPDGTHSVVHGSVVINSDGTHSVIHGSTVINPNGTHSILVGSTIINPNGRTSTLVGGENNDDAQLSFRSKSANPKNKEFKIRRFAKRQDAAIVELLQYLDNWKERQKYKKRKERKQKKEIKRMQRAKNDD